MPFSVTTVSDKMPTRPAAIMSSRRVNPNWFFILCFFILGIWLYDDVNSIVFGLYVDLVRGVSGRRGIQNISPDVHQRINASAAGTNRPPPQYQPKGAQGARGGAAHR